MSVSFTYDHVSCIERIINTLDDKESRVYGVRNGVQSLGIMTFELCQYIIKRLKKNITIQEIVKSIMPLNHVVLLKDIESKGKNVKTILSGENVFTIPMKSYESLSDVGKVQLCNVLINIICIIYNMTITHIINTPSEAKPKKNSKDDDVIEVKYNMVTPRLIATSLTCLLNGVFAIKLCNTIEKFNFKDMKVKKEKVVKATKPKLTAPISKEDTDDECEKPSKSKGKKTTSSDEEVKPSKSKGKIPVNNETDDEDTQSKTSSKSKSLSKTKTSSKSKPQPPPQDSDDDEPESCDEEPVKNVKGKVRKTEAVYDSDDDNTPI